MVSNMCDAFSKSDHYKDKDYQMDTNDFNVLHSILFKYVISLK